MWNEATTLERDRKELERTNAIRASQQERKARTEALGVEMFGDARQGRAAENIKHVTIPREVAADRNIRAAEAAFDEAAKAAKEAADALAAHEYSRLKARADETAKAAKAASDALNEARRRRPDPVRHNLWPKARKTYDRWRAEYEEARAAKAA